MKSMAALVVLGPAVSFLSCLSDFDWFDVGSWFFSSVFVSCELHENKQTDETKKSI